MKKCLQCGNVFSDNYLSCPNCGGMAKVIHEDATRSNVFNKVNTEGSFAAESAGVKNNKRTVAWYESIWCIILGLIVFAPLGVVSLIIRLCNDSYYKKSAGADSLAGNGGYRKSRRKRGIDARLMIAGIALLVLWLVPAMLFIDMGGLIQTFVSLLSVLMIVAGFVCVIWAIAKGGSNKRWERYESLIDNRGNTRISFIAQRTGEKESSVASYIQKMINKGYLDEPRNGISAYINGQYGLIVITRNGKPLVSVEETMASEIKAKEAQRRADEEAARRAKPMSIEDKFLFIINDATEGTFNDEAAEYLRSMEKSVISITRLLKENPQQADKDSIRNMRNIYIPKTIELIEKYQKSSTSEEMKHQIKGIFSTIAKALSNIEKHLREKSEFDTEIDINVLKQTLERDGVLGSDFEI